MVGITTIGITTIGTTTIGTTTIGTIIIGDPNWRMQYRETNMEKQTGGKKAILVLLAVLFLVTLTAAILSAYGDGLVGAGGPADP